MSIEETRNMQDDAGNQSRGHGRLTGVLVASGVAAAIGGLAAYRGRRAGPCRCCEGSAGDWRSRLAAELPLLGHRNWIVVADAAYPAQTSPGIETIATGAEQIEVVRAVLEALDEARHVAPITHLDAEMAHLQEAWAPGINAYRETLAQVLGAREVQTVPHEEIIRKLDDAGQAFRVLLLKSTLAVPYTSVFFQLDCGYWSPENEARLREAMEEAG
jgi:L-fucose mutarotase/ribose pyranase (RbsD/FucU family)